MLILTQTGKICTTFAQYVSIQSLCLMQNALSCDAIFFQLSTVGFYKLGHCFIDWATAVAGEADRELTSVTFSHTTTVAQSMKHQANLRNSPTLLNRLAIFVINQKLLRCLQKRTSSHIRRVKY